MTGKEPKDIRNKEPEFDVQAYKHAISMLESGGGKFMETGINPRTGKHWSSAAGKYHFLYNLIKDDPDMINVTKRQFMNNIPLQEKIMDKALSGKLKGFTYGPNYAKKLKAEYNSHHDVNTLTAMVHFLGAGNVRKYLKDPQGFRVPGQMNMTGDEYMEKFQKHFNQYKVKNYIDLSEKESNITTSSSQNDTIDERLETIKAKDNTAVRQPMMKRMPMQQRLPQMERPVRTDSSQRSESNLSFLTNEFKGGGKMHSVYDASELVTLFEAGGTHEENPNGGIPQGLGANGLPNLVEEGETKFKDYIFSNSIKI